MSRDVEYIFGKRTLLAYKIIDCSKAMKIFHHQRIVSSWKRQFRACRLWILWTEWIQWDTKSDRFPVRLMATQNNTPFSVTEKVFYPLELYVLEICPTLRAFCERINQLNKKRIYSLRSPIRNECLGSFSYFTKRFCALEILNTNAKRSIPRYIATIEVLLLSLAQMPQNMLNATNSTACWTIY